MGCFFFKAQRYPLSYKTHHAKLFFLIVVVTPVSSRVNNVRFKVAKTEAVHQ